MRVNGEPVGKPRRGRPFTRAPYIACKVCNNGWMKDLEDRARPLLLPMLDGFKTVLDRTSQTVIAAWITKTAFSLAAVPSWMIGNPLPRAHRGLLAAGGGEAPPPGVGVLLSFDDFSSAGPNGTINLTAVSGRSLSVEPPGASRRYKMYMLTFRVHRLVARVLGSGEVPLKFGPMQSELEPVHELRLWPLVEEAAQWPPRPLSEVGGFEVIAGRKLAAG